MPHSGKAQGKNQRRILTIFLVALMAGIAVGLPLLRGLIRDRMALLRDDILLRMEDSLGCQIRYSSIAPSFLRALEFRDLRLIDASNGEFLKVKRLSVYYRLDRLLAGRLSESPRQISIVGLQASIDRNEGGGFIDLVKRISGMQGKGGGLDLPNDLRIAFKDISVDYRDGGNSLKVSQADADLFMDSGGLEFSSRFPLSFRLNGGAETRITASAEGSAKKDFSAIRSTVEFKAEARDFSIARQKILLSYREGRIEMRKVEDGSPIDLSANMGMAEGDFALKLDFVRFKPSMLGSFRGNLKKLVVLEDISFSGSGTLSGNLKEPGLGLAYRLDSSAILPHSVLGGGGTLNVAMGGDSRRMEFEDLSLDSGNGRVNAEGSFDLVKMAPEGRLSSDFTWNGLRLAGDAIIRPEDRGRMITLFSERFIVGKQELLSFGLQATPSRDRVELGLESYFGTGLGGEGDSDQASPPAEEAFRAGEAVSAAVSPRMEVSGSLSFGKDSFLELNISLNRLPGLFLSEIGNAFLPLESGTAKLLSEFSFSSEIFFSTDFSQIAYNMPEMIISWDRKQDSYAVISLSGTSDSIDVDSISAFFSGHQLQASLQADYSDLDEVLLSSSLAFDGISYGFSGQFTKGGRFAFSGEHGFALRGSIEEKAVNFSLSMDSFPIPLPGFTPRLSMEAKGRFRNLQDWNVQASSSKLEQRSGFLPSYAEIGFSGEFDQEGGRLGRIELKDEYSSLSGSADLAWTLLEPYSASVILSLASPGGQEKYDVMAAIGGGRISGRASLKEAPVARFMQIPLKGYLSGEALLEGTIDKPLLSFQAALAKAEIFGLPLDMKASGAYAEGILSLASVSGTCFILDMREGKGSYEFADGKLSVSSWLRVTLGQAVMDTGLSLSGSVPAGEGKKISIGGTLEDISIGSYSAASWPLSLTSSSGNWSLLVGDGNQISASLFEDGAFALRLSPPLGMSGAVSGILKEGLIDATAPDLVIDLPVIWRIFGGDFLSFPTGRVRASVAVSGNAKDPEMSGKGTLENLRIRLPGFLKDEYGPISIPITLADNVIEARDIVLSGGGGAATGSITMGFERWIPQNIMVDIATVPDRPVRVGMNLGTIDAEGSASGWIKVDLNPRRLNLSGDFLAEDSSITLAAAKTQEDEEVSDLPIVVAIDISVGRKVEFVWPSRQVPWLRTYMEPGSRLAVNLDSQTGTFSLKGDAKLRGGEVFYFERSFYIREGNMSFNENQDSFDPFITIRADMRDQDDKGPILITMKAERNRLSAFRPRFSSSPTHTEDEILALIGQNMIGEQARTGEGASGVTKGIVIAAGDALAQFTGIRYFENTVRDTFNLDLFSVRSQLLQNVVLGAAGIGAPLDSQSSLGNYFDNTTVMAGKYLGSDLFIQGAVQVQNDPQADFGNLALDWEFSIEWNTPFFRIMWDFFPKDADSLFVNDQSLGIYKSWSF